MKNGVSIILNAHQENRWLISSLKSVSHARSQLSKNNISSEVILIIDNGNLKTIKIALNNSHYYEEMREVNFKNLGLARTEGIKLSKFKYLAFLDADDLISKNWLLEAYKEAEEKQSEDIIYHTEFFASFGKDLEKNNFFILKNLDSESNEFDPLLLVAKWYYCNNIFFNKKIIQNIPIEAYNHSKGFGSEDWHWTCLTLLANVKRSIVAQTTYFYRIKNIKQSLGSASGLVITPNKIFLDMIHSENFLLKNFIDKDISFEFKENQTVINQAIEQLEFEYDLFEILKNVEHYRLSTQIFCYAAAHLYAKLKIFCKYDRPLLTFLNLTKVNSLVKNAEELFFNKTNEKKIYLIEGMSTDKVYSFRNNILIINIDQLKKSSSIDFLCQSLANFIVSHGAEIFNFNSNIYEFLSSTYYKVFHSNKIFGAQIFIESIRDFDDGRWLRNYLELIYTNEIYALKIYLTNEEDIDFALNVLKLPNSIVSKISCPLFEFSSKNLEDYKFTDKKLPELVDLEQHITLLSIVLNLSTEGMMLIPSINSVIESIRNTDFQDKVELILVADSINDATRNALYIYFEKYRYENIKISIIESYFQNLSQSRILGLKKSLGKYISFIDGDDLISTNWVADSIKMIIEEPSDTVFHPELVIQFNEAGYLRHTYHPEVLVNEKEKALGLLNENYWTSLFLCRREIVEIYFDEVLSSDGFGFEDWTMYLNSLCQNVSHKIISNTIHYVRVKKKSLSNDSHLGNLLPNIDNFFLLKR
jgi:glycosyltransferase involved in cell wall biosynthesis